LIQRFLFENISMNYIIIVVALLLLAFAIITLSRQQKRKAATFPPGWHNLLCQHVHFYDQLTATEQKRFQKRMMQFLSEVYIESIDFELEDLDKLLVAASAIIPVFAFPDWHYINLSTVLIYPDHFNDDLNFGHKDEQKHIAGMVGSGRFNHQMILSRKALHEGFDKKSDLHNTGIHEFVHLIDMTDGVADGTPERLIAHSYSIPWLKLIHREMEAINDNKSDIRSYGGTNEAEFFAVASEYFFENPILLKKNHPELYEMLSACFHKK